jgi:hypothetical protein
MTNSIQTILDVTKEARLITEADYTRSKEYFQSQVEKFIETEKLYRKKPISELKTLWKDRCGGRVSLEPDSFSKAQLIFDICACMFGKKVADASLKISAK